MIFQVKYPVALAAIFIWIGFVAAISFMEAWLKFRAPGITVPLGLGIGRLVFSALNKVEWVLLLCVLINLIFFNKSANNSPFILVSIPIIILLLQTFWLLPALDARAALLIKGAFVPPSKLHVYFIFVEFIKLIMLLWLGSSFFEKQNKIHLNHSYN